LSSRWPYCASHIQSGRPVREILAEAIPATHCWQVYHVAGINIGVGIWGDSCTKTAYLVRHLISVISVFGYSLPSYVAAMLLALVFGFALGQLDGA